MFGVLRSILFLIVLIPAITGRANAQALCDDARLQDAASAYEYGRFPATLNWLKPCMPNGFSGRDQRMEAYRLLALSYISVDSLQQARVWARQLVKTNARYRPDPETGTIFFIG